MENDNKYIKELADKAYVAQKDFLDSMMKVKNDTDGSIIAKKECTGHDCCIPCTDSVESCDRILCDEASMV